jgi:hypothetical protein
MRVRLAVAVILSAFQLSAFAQSQTLTGSWALEAPGVTGPNFQLSSQAGTMTLEQKGDAVTGTWKGRMPEPWKLTGSLRGNAFELQTEVRQLPATRDGESTTVARSWIFRGKVNGDKMTGTMMLAGGEGEPPSQPFSAARKK